MRYEVFVIWPLIEVVVCQRVSRRRFHVQASHFVDCMIYKEEKERI